MQALKESRSFIDFYSNCVPLKNKIAKYTVLTISISTVVIPIFIGLAYLFMRAAQNHASRSLEQSGIGTVYEITNLQGVKSYLIGTMHMTDEDMIKKSYFHRVINKCSRLYSEMGMNEFIPADLKTSPIGDKVRGTEQYKNSKYRFSLDLAIAQTALARKIPILSLDEGLPENDQNMIQIWEAYLRDSSLVAENERRWMADVERNTRKPAFLEFYNRVKEGDVESLQKYRNSHQTIDEYIREDHWCKTLIPDLMHTEKPICIDVGVLHVVGDEGLSGRFRDAGLTVELIPNARKGT